jgi:sodium/proline symporter
MGIKKVDEISQAKYLSSAWQTIALASATLTGLIGIAYFKVGSINPELLFRTLTTDLFGSFWSGFILCAVLAAGIASIAIQILFLATTLAHDIYKRFFNPNTSINNLLFISRSTVILVSGIAWLLALHQQNTIHALVKHAWTGLGCSFGPLVIAALYGKKITAFAATMGVLVGGVMVLASSKLGFSPTDPKLPFTVGSLIIFGISYISNISKPEKRN